MTDEHLLRDLALIVLAVLVAGGLGVLLAIFL